MDFLQTSAILADFAVRGDSSAIAGVATAKAAITRTILIPPPCRAERCRHLRRRRSARFHSVDLQSLRSAFHRFGEFAGQERHCMQTMYRQADQWPEVHDKRIALIFQIELEPLGRKYRRTSRRPGIPSGKRQRRAFEQENSTDLSLDVAG